MHGLNVFILCTVVLEYTKYKSTTVACSSRYYVRSRTHYVHVPLKHTQNLQ
jgi:hypothetical protein